jgi:hypothetical protein
MRKHLGNFSLLIILFGLLAVPLAGFKFVTYDSNGNVLSGETVRQQNSRVKKDLKTIKEDKDSEDKKEKEPEYYSPSNVIKFFR